MKGIVYCSSWLHFLSAGAELDTLTRPSDVFSIGKALKQGKIVVPCSKPSFRRNLTNTERLPRSLFPKLVFLREEFIVSLIVCFNIYCVFVFLFKNICFSF